MAQCNTKLIADIGVSEGNDTAYYLRKGFDVVGVEANPVMFERLLKRFQTEIAAGRLTLLNRVACGISGQTVRFWRNEKFPPLSTANYDTAQGREFLVECSAPSADWKDITSERGIPYYSKIDIEGGEKDLLRSMAGTDLLSPFISVECHTFEPVRQLHELGYARFKFVNQAILPSLAGMLPNPAKEGTYISDPDWRAASGPFGHDLPGRWLAFEEAIEIFATIARLRAFETILRPCWFDCHGALPGVIAGAAGG